MSFNVKRQLLGAAGAGGGAAYFFAVIETPTDADKRNCIHGIVDSSDNIYVDFDYYQSGSDYRLGLVKFDTGGNLLAERYLSNVVYRPSQAGELFVGNWKPVFDSSDNYYIVGKGSQGFQNPVYMNINTSNLTITSKFEREFSSGSLYGGFWSDSANAYLAGSTGFSGVGNFGKFNSSGTNSWAKTLTMSTPFGGPGVFFTGGGEDSSGNVYAVGTHPFLGYRGVLVKYNSSGTLQWARHVYQGNDNNSFQLVKCDSSGNPYLVGWMGASGGSEIAYVAKFNSSGSFQWDYAHQYDDTKGSFQSIDFDSSGNVYLAGTMLETGFSPGVFGSYKGIGCYVKLNSSGTLQWQRGISFTSTRTGMNNGTFATVAIDSNDDMILTTSQSDGSNNVRHYIARLPNDGTLTGSYNVADVKYGATNMGDKAIGGTNTPTTTASTTSVVTRTPTVADNSVTFSITTETA